MGLVMNKKTVHEKQAINKQSHVARNISLMSAIFYILATSVIAMFANSSSAQKNNSALTIKEQQSLIYLLKQDCGSCHGLTLQGGLGPALLKKNLKDKPQAYIESVIAYGRPGTPMPPWKEILDQKQIRFLAKYLLSNDNTLANHVKNIQPIKNSQAK